MINSERRFTGSVTIFLSLCMVLILSLVFAAVESARVSGLRYQIQTAGKASMESLFSNYNNKLLEEYKVLFLEDTEEISDLLRNYMSYYEDPYKNLDLEGGNFFPFQVGTITVSEAVYATDQGGLPMETEIKEWMKYQMTSDGLNEILGNLDFFGQCQKVSSYLNKILEHSSALINLHQNIMNLSERFHQIKQTYSQIIDYKDEIVDCIKDLYQQVEQDNNEELWKTVVQSAGSVDKLLENLKGQMGEARKIVENYQEEAAAMYEGLKGITEELNQDKIFVDSDVFNIIKDELDQVLSFCGEKGEWFERMNGFSANLLKNSEVMKTLPSMSDLKSFAETRDLESLSQAASDWSNKMEMFLTDEIEQQLGNDQADSGNISGKNLIDMVKDVLEDGLLGLVIEDTSGLSERVIEGGNLPSSVLQGDSDNETGGAMMDLLDKAESSVVINEYLTRYIKCYTDEETYDLEYIIGSSSKDKKNLESVIGKILTIREGMNFIYLAKDSQKRSEARTVAVALVGATGIAPLIEGMCLLILTAWAFAESVVDVKDLLEGDKVPLLKNESDWNLSLENVSGGSSQWNRKITNGSDNGLDYRQYLSILLYFVPKEKKLYRCMDIMQWDIQQDDPGFLMSKCIYKMEINIECNAAQMFSRFVFGNGWRDGGYKFVSKASFQY